MRRTAWTTMAAATVVVAFAAPAEAQRYRFDIGVNGGGSWYSTSLDEDHLTADDAEVRFEAGWIAGGQLTYWVPSIFGMHDRLGIRANFAFSERPLELETDEPIGRFADGDDLADDVNLWSGTGDLLFRFMGPDPERYMGVEWLPYIALGAGAKWIDPAFQNFADDDVDGQIINLNGDAFLLKEETEFMGLVGLGTDVRLARSFALRLEVGDRIWDSPMSPLLRQNGAFVLQDPDEDFGNVIHELYGQLGLHLLLGLARPEPVAVAPPPPAPPPPPPPPAEEAVMICVVDPATGELTMVDAIYLPATRDTVAVVDGERVAFEAAYPENPPLYVADAEWLQAGRPLSVTVAGRTTEWVTFGGARVIDPDELALLGMVNGTPVYADADEVADIGEQLEDMREAGLELDEIMEQNAEIREELLELDTVYVPLETGCVFQPLSRVEEVRKVRG